MTIGSFYKKYLKIEQNRGYLNEEKIIIISLIKNILKWTI